MADLMSWQGEYDHVDQPGLLARAWEARPWKDYATNPPSMAPQLAVALGLLHPSLGGATRNMGLATQLSRQGVAPAAMQGMPAGMPAPVRPGGGMRTGESFGISADPGKVPGNQNGNYAIPGRLGAREQMRAYESYIDSLPMNEHPVAYQTFKRMQGL